MKKIMFNDNYGLTQAVLDGKKTQTRRLIPKNKLLIVESFREEYYDLTFDYLNEKEAIEHYFLAEYKEKLPYQIGEIVGIAQAYKDFYNDECNPTLFPSGAGWFNKMFVKGELMPHQIKITRIRIEQLQDISDEDCLKEGIFSDESDSKFPPCTFYNYVGNQDNGFKTARDAYASLINKISGNGTWEMNPYVFVYDFELIR